MNIDSIVLARSIWLFPFQELNPKGLSLSPLLSFLLGKYNFLNYPKGDEARTQPYKFEDGSFVNKAGHQLAVNLNVYWDGLVAETRASTEDTDLFLHELLTSLHEGFPLLRSYEEILRRKAYSSEMYIQSEYSFSLMNPIFDDFIQILNSKAQTGNQPPFLISGVAFQQDPQMTGSAPFRLERAVNAPYSENKYYTAAPLETRIHVELLEILESTIAGHPYQQ